MAKCTRGKLPRDYFAAEGCTSPGYKQDDDLGQSQLCIILLRLTWQSCVISSERILVPFLFRLL